MGLSVGAYVSEKPINPCSEDEQVQYLSTYDYKNEVEGITLVREEGSKGFMIEIEKLPANAKFILVDASW